MWDKDDRASAFFDDDKNNAIESTADNLHGNNANRNWESAVLSLTAGNKHIFAAGMMEGGGGSRMRLSIKTPTITSWAHVDPTSPAQDGFWILEPTAPWGDEINPMSLWDKGDFGFQYIGSTNKTTFTHTSTEESVTLTAGATVPLNTWKHLTAVVDRTAGTVKTYVDGVQDQTGSFTAGAPAKDVGESPFIFNSSIQASFDELRAETAARSADWVKATYDNQKGGCHLLDFRFGYRCSRVGKCPHG